MDLTKRLKRITFDHLLIFSVAIMGVVIILFAVVIAATLENVDGAYTSCLIEDHNGTRHIVMNVCLTEPGDTLNATQGHASPKAQ